MRDFAELAVSNLIHHGDTDVFPYPFETRAFFDQQTELVELLETYHASFDAFLVQYPPSHMSSLVPVGYSGFRWATQLDPIWNAYFLTCVIACGQEIETARIPKSDQTVFSYRYKPKKDVGDLFDRESTWRDFIIRSEQLASSSPFVVSCDVSEFYLRLDHHRLENALLHLALENEFPKRIERFLHNFSNTRSFGLPIGGPAARLLSELVLNQIDRLLNNEGVAFARFADDFHLFCQSREDAYRVLIFLSEKLFLNQGLLLQKSKTRIVSGSEFRATSPLRSLDRDGSQSETSRALLQFAIRFDPYSPTAADDYERLKREIEKFDIIGLLKQEISKSRVHAALARKIISAVRFLDGKVRDDAIVSLIQNAELLYPIFSAVLVVIQQTFKDLGEEAQEIVKAGLRSLIESRSHVMRVDVHLDLAIRIIGRSVGADDDSLLKQIFARSESPMIRRDVILALSGAGDWYWLSDLRNSFANMTGPERRAFLVASFKLRDEGVHWRRHVRPQLSPFEAFIGNWAASKAKDQNWKPPL